MKKTPLLRLMIASAVCFAIIWSCKTSVKVETDSYLPLDVQQSCVVSDTLFNSWFSNGKASENGFVNPANSVTFGHANNCEFYQWSQQMFLWITSPSQGAYGKNGRVFESPVFYTVSPEDSIGKRSLIKHESGVLLSAMPMLEKSVGLESEEGQATGDVLMTKDGAIVYYITMVNDVYAEFLCAVGENKMAGNTFPTTQQELDSIAAYAKTKGVNLPDAQALAIELKTSWVDASTVKNIDDYLTINAVVPTYTKTKTNWTISGQTTVKLAMLGMHIVGSVAAHPEMVWSTFEHRNTAPNLAYTYLNEDNKVVTVPADTGNDWLLNSNSASADINISHMKFKHDSIYSKRIVDSLPERYTISPSNTARTKPWGFADGGVPNGENPDVASANSQVISINNSIISQLPGNDIRKNYLFIGSTWTSGGAAPDGTSYSATNTQAGTAIGGSQLANTTMETYIQNGTSYNENGSCFYCHSTSPPSVKPNAISHVFGDITPVTVSARGKVFFKGR